MTKRFPGALVARLLSAALLLSACEGDFAEAPPPEPASTGGYTGELVVHMFDFLDRTEIRHVLRSPDGATRQLDFPAGAPELASGTPLRVFGTDDGQVLTVRRFDVLEDPASAGLDRRASALINGVKKKTKKWAFVLVDTGAGVALTKEDATRRLFSTEPTSIASYYKEVSYGTQELTGDVLGPFKVSATVAASNLCQNFGAVANELGPMIQGAYDQYLWYLGKNIPRCWAGIALLGSADRPGRHTFYNNIAACVVLVQEPGHNFGMVHSSTMNCTRGGAPVSMVVPGDGTCQHDEYGSPFDPMGGGSVGAAQNLNRCYHMNGVQKAYQDWLGGCNVVKTSTSGTYTIYPLETACNGVQMLQVPLASPRVLQFPPSPAATLRSGTISAYYVELRAPVGLDTALQTPRVFIVAAGDLRESNQRGNPNWLIDTTPETRSVLDAQLAVGKTFTDPAPGGPKITVISADATKAVIQVQVAGGQPLMTPGTGVCGNDMPFTAPGPSECGAAAAAPPSDGGGPVPVADAGATDTGGVSTPGPIGQPGVDAAPTVPGPGPIPVDAGGARTDTGNNTPPVVGETAALESSSCSCRVGAASTGGGSAPLTALALLALALMIRRRRR
jgi:MYXO-CTERM domain-containing protein